MVVWAAVAVSLLRIGSSGSSKNYTNVKLMTSNSSRAKRSHRVRSILHSGYNVKALADIKSRTYIPNTVYSCDCASRQHWYSHRVVLPYARACLLVVVVVVVVDVVTGALLTRHQTGQEQTHTHIPKQLYNVRLRAHMIMAPLCPATHRRH